MRILLIGYGKMGKAIEKFALDRGHEIAGRSDLNDRPPFPKADVAVEFSQPEAAVKNILQCIEQKIPVVCGTTGWLDKKEEVERECARNNGTLFYSSNYSLGVNLFFRLNEFLAGLMDRYPEYNVAIDETHHSQKKDAPSGTAITLAQGVMKNLKRKKKWASGDDIPKEAISIHSFRIDPAPGTHVVKYQSAVDDIEIRHTAHSREGFASGAVLVAEWIRDKKGVLGMNDFLQF
jgi:4-hydroxy-tetrahydrodipicolinate reductase